MEKWKQVKGYEGFYEISNKGRVRTVERKVKFGKNERIVKSNILVPNDKGSNYLTVKLSKNNKVKRKYIHIMVAEAFVPNPYNKPQINHVNKNTKDNRDVNLEWCTALENSRHSNMGKYNPNYSNYTKFEVLAVSQFVFKQHCKNKGWDFESFIKKDSNSRTKSGAIKYFWFRGGNK